MKSRKELFDEFREDLRKRDDLDSWSTLALVFSVVGLVAIGLNIAILVWVLLG
jgi:cytoskeletal protein RodZ